MRLPKRIFLAVALIVGVTAGFAPDASAHLNTETAAEVAGIVAWPGGATCATQGSTNGLVPAQNTWAGMVGAGVANPAGLGGLPLGAHSDLCFDFTTLTISAAGTFEGVVHQTNFDCASEGVSGAASGAPTEVTGAFDGDFSCGLAGPPTGPGAAPLVGVAPMGHFHGQSAGGTIRFMGAIGPVGAGSVLLHTLSCEGQVRVLTTRDKDGNGVNDTVVTAAVTLECVIS